MNTRLTGRDDHAAVPCCNQSAMSGFCSASVTTSPSIPAVCGPR